MKAREARVYLYRGTEDVECALQVWLHDEFGGAEQLALLMVDMEGLRFLSAAETGYEIALTSPVAPSRITIVGSEVDAAVDLEVMTIEAIERYDACCTRLGAQANDWLQMSPLRRWEMALESGNARRGAGY